VKVYFDQIILSEFHLKNDLEIVETLQNFISYLNMRTSSCMLLSGYFCLEFKKRAFFALI